MKDMSRICLVGVSLLSIFSASCSRPAPEKDKEAVAAINEGIGHFRAKEYSEAIEAFSVAIEIDPAYATAYERRAKAYDAVGDRNRRDDDLVKAATLRMQPELVAEIGTETAFMLRKLILPFILTIFIVGWLIIRRVNIIIEFFKECLYPEKHETALCPKCGRENSIHTRRCPRCESLLVHSRAD